MEYIVIWLIIAILIFALFTYLWLSYVPKQPDDQWWHEHRHKRRKGKKALHKMSLKSIVDLDRELDDKYGTH